MVNGAKKKWVLKANCTYLLKINMCPTEPGQHIEGTVAQKGNVDVVTQCQKPQRIPQQGCEEYLPL